MTTTYSKKTRVLIREEVIGHISKIIDKRFEPLLTKTDFYAKTDELLKILQSTRAILADSAKD